MMISKKEARKIAKLYNEWIEVSRSTKSPNTVASYELTVNMYFQFLISKKKYERVVF